MFAPKPLRVLVGISVAAPVVGCGAVQTSQSDVTPDPSVKARLDYENVQVIMPLDEYLMTEADVRTLARAQSVIVAPCVQAKGYEEDMQVRPLGEARPFGLWSVERAKKYGMSMPGLVDERTRSRAQDEAFGACVDQYRVEVDAFMPALQEPSVAQRTQSESYLLASRNSQWQQAREENWACLEAAGLTPIKEDNRWGTREDLERAERSGGQSGNQEEDIVLAVKLATCNERTQLTQKLADLQASYQSPLIKRNQAALNEEKRKKQDMLHKARTYVSENQ